MIPLLDAVLDLGALGVLVGLLLLVWVGTVGAQVAATALVIAVVAALLLARIDRAQTGRPRPPALDPRRVRRDTVGEPVEETRPQL